MIFWFAFAIVSYLFVVTPLQSNRSRGGKQRAS